jgi:hypothetical protein
MIKSKISIEEIDCKLAEIISKALDLKEEGKQVLNRQFIYDKHA